MLGVFLTVMSSVEQRFKATGAEHRFITGLSATEPANS